MSTGNVFSSINDVTGIACDKKRYQRCEGQARAANDLPAALYCSPVNVMSASCSYQHAFSCTGCELTLCDFIVLSENEESFMRFLYDHRIIPKSMSCPSCGNAMCLDETKGIFRCNKRINTVDSNRKKVSKHCNKRISQNIGTWFSKHNLTKKQICRLVAFWIFLKPPRQDFLCNEICITPRTCVDWCNYLREVCVFAIQRASSGKIGGPGKVVEIDEAKIGHRKYNRGRVVDGNWIFGGIERNSNRCFFKPVPNRGSETLLSTITEHILPGTTIISDCWKSYNCLQFEGYKHLTVNHSVNFVDPDTGAHTQGIERTWREVRGNVPRYGNRKHHLAGHLADFMFRRLYPDHKQRIHAIFTAISQLYDWSESPENENIEASQTDSDDSENDF